MVPQFLPCMAQVTGLQPHLLATPPPPQVLGIAQKLPQSMTLPQPSEIVPHWAPSSAQFFGEHGRLPQRFAPSPPQISGAVHAPQLTIPPQPSGNIPQLTFFDSHVAGVQPHRWGVPPPPQVRGAAHVPQLSIPPHESATIPQSAAS